MRAQSIKTERGPAISLDTPDLLKKARYELSRNNSVLLKVSGRAMQPAIEENDVVTVEPVNAQAVRVGDIVLYQSLRDTALIHRVLRVEQRSSGRFLVTRGDASTALDAPVPIHHVMGRVSMIDRDGERIEIRIAPRGMRGWLEALVARLRALRGGAA